MHVDRFIAWLHIPETLRNFRFQGVNSVAPKRFLAMAAAMALSAAGLTACSGGDDDGGDSGSGGNVSMTLWHNSTTGPGKEFWEKTVADFQTAHPTVKITIQSVHN